MKRILYVAVGPPWPATQGGEVRMANIVEALSEDHDVHVVAWSPVAAPAAPVPITTLEGAGPPTRLSGFASWKPRIMTHIAGGRAREHITEVLSVDRYDLVMFSHSYVAAAVGRVPLPTIVDFANIESARYRTFARTRRGTQQISAGIEWFKSLRWEPAVARSATLSVALSEADASWLQHRGARTVVVPNGATAPQDIDTSPNNETALFFGSMDYPPNADGARWIVENVWPVVQERTPTATLQIAGRHSKTVLGDLERPGVEILGPIEDIAILYRNASVVLAPVATGAGRQLKVTEALTYGRAMVCTAYSLESVPDDLKAAIPSADGAREFGTAVADLLSNHEDRHRREATIARSTSLQSWPEVVRPLLERIEAL